MAITISRRAAATRAADVTRKLLTDSRHQPVAAEVVRVEDLLYSIHDDIAIMLADANELRFIIDQPAPVLVDPSQLEQDEPPAQFAGEDRPS